MGNVSSQNPLYAEFIKDWEQMRDTYRGERIVKSKGVEYLPMTSGMLADGAGSGKGTLGDKAYAAYKARAVFPELVGDAVEAMLGVMHYKPPTIELPKALEHMLERATLRNESLEALLRRINEEQLVTGRVGLLLEIPDGQPIGETKPFIAMYQAESAINWDEGDRDTTHSDALNLVVLDESEDERDEGGFDWKRVEKYRVLTLGELVTNENEQAGAVYKVGVFREGTTFSEEDMVAPSIAGRTIEEVPFVFINTKDVVTRPDDPPLVGLSSLTLTIYRGEADYRQALFMQGQDTLVTIGWNAASESDVVRTGSGAHLSLPMDGDAKYIGVESSGLPEMRSALENDYKRGENKATALVDAVGKAAESGEALRVRVAARTASLNQIALTGAFGLQELLKKAARWIGANPNEVVVTPNLDFVSDTVDGRTLVDYMAAKKLGLPWSLEQIHSVMRARGLTELTFEEEIDAIQKEAEDGLADSMDAVDNQGATDEGAPVDGQQQDQAAQDEQAQEGAQK